MYFVSKHSFSLFLPHSVRNQTNENIIMGSKKLQHCFLENQFQKGKKLNRSLFTFPLRNLKIIWKDLSLKVIRLNPLSASFYSIITGQEKTFITETLLKQCSLFTLRQRDPKHFPILYDKNRLRRIVCSQNDQLRTNNSAGKT